MIQLMLLMLQFLRKQWMSRHGKLTLVAATWCLLHANGFALDLPKNFEASKTDQKTQVESVLSRSGWQLAHPVLILDKWLPDLSVLVVFARNASNVEDTDVKIGFYTAAQGRWTLRDTALVGGYGHYLKIVSVVVQQTKTGKYPKFFVISQLIGSEYGKRAASLYRTKVYWAEITQDTFDVYFEPKLSAQFVATPEYRENDTSTEDVNGIKNAADLRRRLKELPW